MTATMSEEAAGRLRRGERKMVADRTAFEALAAGRDRTPGSTSTTTPEGIVKHDPNAVAGDGNNCAIKNARKIKPGGRTKSPAADAPAAATATVKMPEIGAKPMSVRVSTICRHPANRRPSPQQVADRAASMQRDGLLEPIIVRYIDDDARFDDKSVNYQLLSGETRWLAAQQLGWERIDVRACQANDQQALLLLAAANSQREDLDPIQTAELLAELVKPAAEGGGGMSHAEAAAQFSRDSASWVVNLIRLLELPEPWRGRLISREIEPTLARVLVPLVKAPPVLAKVNDDWDNEEEEPLRNLTREAFTERVLNITEENTVSADPKVKRHYSPYDFGKPWGEFECGEYPILFDIEAVRDQLGIVELTVPGLIQRRGNKRETVTEPRITNVALFGKLQLAEIKKLKKKKAAREDAKDAKQTKKAKAAAKELTPAQRKAKAAEQQRILDNRIGLWRRSMLRFQVAQAIGVNDVRVLKLFVWYATNSNWKTSHHVDVALEFAVGTKGRASADPWDSLTIGDTHKAAHAVARELLWPAKREPADDDLPGDVIESMAEDCGVSMEMAWGDAQKNEPVGAGLLYQKFFELHNREQLVALGKELGVHIGDNVPKSTAVKLFTAVPRHLKLPACLKPTKKRGAK